MEPKGSQNKGLKGAEIGLFWELGNLVWIWQALYLSHIGLPSGAPGRHSKSDPDPEPLPDIILDRFGAI